MHSLRLGIRDRDQMSYDNIYVFFIDWDEFSESYTEILCRNAGYFFEFVSQNT